MWSSAVGDLPREPEVPCFNYCFMLNLSPATLTLKRTHVLFFSMIKRKKKVKSSFYVLIKIPERINVFHSKKI